MSRQAGASSDLRRGGTPSASHQRSLGAGGHVRTSGRLGRIDATPLASDCGSITGNNNNNRKRASLDGAKRPFRMRDSDFYGFSHFSNLLSLRILDRFFTDFFTDLAI